MSDQFASVQLADDNDNEFRDNNHSNTNDTDKGHLLNTSEGEGESKVNEDPFKDQEHYRNDNTTTKSTDESTANINVEETTPIIDIFGSQNDNDAKPDYYQTDEHSEQQLHDEVDNTNNDETKDDTEGSGLITQTMILGSQQDSAVAVDETAPEAADVDEPVQQLSHANTYAENAPLEQSTMNTQDITLDYELSVTVKDPITENEGSNTFTAYHLHIKSTNPRLHKKEYTIMHRYSDFDTLHKCLSYDFPTLLIPPLPNKQRLEYIKGGRFTDEFVTKRCNSLNVFMQRVIKHPVLRKSEVLLIFLEDNEYWKTYRNNLSFNDGNPMNASHEGVTDFLMNSFKKPHIEGKFNKNFKEIDYQRLKLQENLNKIDKIYTKVIGKQDLISREFGQFGEEFNKLSILLNNDYNGKYREESDLDEETKQIVSQFKKFSDNLKKSGSHYNELNKYIEFNYLNNLKDLEHYLVALGNSIKLKDYKILDYEMLNNYLEKTVAERDNLVNGGSLTATTEGTISYLSRKFESLTGLGGSHQPSGYQPIAPQSNGTDGSNSTNRSDTSSLINERIEKLNARIDLLKKEKENAKEVYENFEKDLLNEWSQFQHVKDDEISSSLQDLSKEYTKLYADSLAEWSSFDASKESINLKTQLQNDEVKNKYFGSSQVMQNHEEIQRLMQELES